MVNFLNSEPFTMYAMLVTAICGAAVILFCVISSMLELRHRGYTRRAKSQVRTSTEIHVVK